MNQEISYGGKKGITVKAMPAMPSDTSGTVMNVTDTELIRTRQIQISQISPHYHPEISELYRKIGELTEDVNKIKELIEATPVRLRIVEITDVSVDEAKKMILDYLAPGKIVYPSDVADELGLDLKITVQALEELSKEGKIKEAR